MTHIPLPESVARQYQAPRPDEWSEDRVKRLVVVRVFNEAGLSLDQVRFARWLIKQGKLSS